MYSMQQQSNDLCVTLVLRPVPYRLQELVGGLGELYRAAMQREATAVGGDASSQVQPVLLSRLDVSHCVDGVL